MNTRLFSNPRRRLVALAVAAFIALSATYAPMALDQVASTNLTPVAAACGHPWGDC
ncbi:MAG: hypothetical protein R2867_47730 [Caldilineaceae bacterium]